MPWTIRDAKRERRVIENIERGEDRSAAILACSYLEDTITRAIKARLVPDVEVYGKNFKGTGPLATFAAKIDLAYLLGFYPRKMRDALHILKEIRNRFAHRLDAHDFDTQCIKDLCQKLFRPSGINGAIADIERIAKDDPDGRGYNIFLFVLKPLAMLPDTPRNAYMSTIKLIMVAMECQTQAVRKDAGHEWEDFSVVLLPEPSLDKFL